ncbi:MAG: pyridoxal-dependent decarboxylase, partial [Phaeodactylibacter sp.]|nr:pyridoxal-dependent decarboxylase [Phaeodactylibacter sp.]
MDILQSAYDPEKFRALGHQLIDLLADHLATVQDRQVPATSFTPPDAQAAFWQEDLSKPSDNPIDYFKEILGRSVQVQHP